MNILHICNKVPFPGRDGSSIAMESLIRLLAKAGHHVTVLALNTDKHQVRNPQVPQALKSKVEMKTVQVNIKPGLKSLLNNWGRKESYFASRFYSEKMVHLIRSEREEKNHDFVLFDSLFSSVYSSEFSDLPKVLRAHNVEHRIWSRHLQVMERGVKKLFVDNHANKLKAWEQEVFGEMDGVWAISEDDRNIIRELCPTCSPEYLPCTFDDKTQWPYSGAASGAAYHLGAMDWGPNILGMEWFLSKVWPLLPESDRPNLSIISRVKPAAFENQLPGINWITERVDDAWFNEVGVLIAPLHSGSGMRIKLLEGMARGKAILTTTIGAEGLGAEHGVHLHLEDEPENFAKALLHLCGNKEYRTSLGNEARKHAVARFSDEAYIRQIDQNTSKWFG